jgi:DNA-binding LacI/PurR family transcriptional regulator
VNIGEIARRAGVSRSTVSYALTGNRPVSQATRERIAQVIDELDYRPSATARALAEGRTRTLALVVPPVRRRMSDMQLTFVASVVEAAAARDLDVLLSPSGGDHDRSFERVVSSRRADGVILMEIGLEDARVTRLQGSTTPFVTIGRIADPVGTTWVDVDYEGLVGRCVQHLADLGHRSLALVNRPAELLAAGYGPAHRAQAGFRSAVDRRGLAGETLACDDDRSAAEQAVLGLLTARPDITALVTINEAALAGIEHALERLGRVVPRDFSVAAVAAGHWAEAFRPSLTTADVPAVQMGAEAVALLCDRIADPARPHQHVLAAPAISLRDSTGPAPAPA